MAAYFRLQDLVTVSTASSQRIDEAVDVGRYKTLTAQLRKATGATSGTLQLQHAAVLEETAFTDVASPTFNLTGAGNDVQVFSNLLRFVRWRVSPISGSSQFILDIVAREE